MILTNSGQERLSRKILELHTTISGFTSFHFQRTFTGLKQGNRKNRFLIDEGNGYTLMAFSFTILLLLFYLACSIE